MIEMPSPKKTAPQTPFPQPGNKDFALAAYAFDLPEEQIAQHPARQRDESRLMALDARGGEIEISSIRALARHLPENCLLVANNSRVVPARLAATRPGGGKAEFLLLTPLPFIQAQSLTPNRHQAVVEGLVRPAKRLKAGAVLTAGGALEIEIMEIGAFGRALVALRWSSPARPDGAGKPGGAAGEDGPIGEDGIEALRALLFRHGRLPLPPYIRRQPGREDAERYQTAFSRAGEAEGSVAAPTAGLHFTPALIAELIAAGHEWREITLHVGYGTFSPVRTDDIRQHVMHREYYTIPEETAEALQRALIEGRPIVAVGTTSARTLEGARRGPRGLTAHSGSTDIFIYPGYAFQVISGLITNFHLPESTLLMLVSAMAGRERLLAAYAQAVARGFRFFSYGDCMLVLDREAKTRNRA